MLPTEYAKIASRINANLVHCVRALESYIAVGSSDGTVKVYSTRS
jgi:hypothetical protein